MQSVAQMLWSFTELPIIPIPSQNICRSALTRGRVTVYIDGFSIDDWSISFPFLSLTLTCIIFYSIKQFNVFNDLCNAEGRVQIIQIGEHLGAECSRSTSNQSKIVNHLPAPSGDKMHKCSECQKSFGQAGHLKIHMLTHSKERTYACVQCQRS